MEVKIFVMGVDGGTWVDEWIDGWTDGWMKYMDE